MSKILIIGGNGFIGVHVANYLISIGHKVVIFDKNNNKNKLLNPICPIHFGNILNSKNLEKIISKSNIVFNFAALADIDIARTRPEETATINILGTIRILKLCKKYNVRRFVQASSIYSISEEGGFYAISKRSSEEYIEEFGRVFRLNYTILRFGTIYGEGADNNNGLKKLIVSATKFRKIIYNGSSKAKRKFIYVKDLAILSNQILKDKYKNKLIVLTGKKTIKITKVINFIASHFRIKKNKIIYKNIKNSSHYVVKPSLKKIKKGVNLFLKKEENFKKKLINLINNQ